MTPVRVHMAGFVRKDGVVISAFGEGFNVVHPQAGVYEVQFNAALNAPPVVVATSTGEVGAIACSRLVNQNSARIELIDFNTGTGIESGFHFIVASNL